MHYEMAIDLKNVEKLYPGGWGITGRRARVHALRGIDMQVHRGSVFGLLGPNGAGKSTLVKILMTVIRPTRCEGTFMGGRVGDKALLKQVGYLPEHHRFPEYLTAAQVLDYFGALGDVPHRERKARSAELLDLVGLTNWTNSKVKGFSKGMRQRLGIANALIGNPDLIVLDEPTDGVDPVGRKDIREVLLKLRDQGKTVFLNSHLLSELEMLCDRVAILVQGKVSAQGTIDELTRDSRRYEIEVAHRPEPGPSLDEVAQSTGRSTGVSLRVQNSTLVIPTDDPAGVQPVIDALRQSRYTIKSVRPVRNSLEDLFMQAVTDPATGKALVPGAKAHTKNGGIA